MPETLGTLLGYIDEVLPNPINSTTKIIFINDEIKEFWPYMTSTDLYDFNLTADQELYSLSTNGIDTKRIVENGLLVSDSTAAISSTSLLQPYYYHGADDELDGYKYYEVENQIGIYPIPSAAYMCRIRYQKYPTLYSTTTDSTTILDIDQDFIKVIKYRVLSRVCKTGNFPRVDLANAYEIDAAEILRKLRLRRYQNRVKTPRKRVSHLEWW